MSINDFISHILLLLLLDPCPQCGAEGVLHHLVEPFSLLYQAVVVQGTLHCFGDQLPQSQSPPCFLLRPGPGKIIVRRKKIIFYVMIWEG